MCSPCAPKSLGTAVFPPRHHPHRGALPELDSRVPEAGAPTHGVQQPLCLSEPSPEAALEKAGEGRRRQGPSGMPGPLESTGGKGLSWKALEIRPLGGELGL